jgi:hypothetical protein
MKPANALSPLRRRARSKAAGRVAEARLVGGVAQAAMHHEVLNCWIQVMAAMRKVH